MVAQSGDMVLAHGIGGRSDLPVPLWLAMYAGAVVVLVSFFALAMMWTTPRLKGDHAGRPLPMLEKLANAAITRGLLQILGVALLIVFLVTAWLGPDDNGRANPAPTWIYVWFWVGLVPLSILCGPIWRRINPLRTFSKLIRLVIRRPPVDLPARLGYWPAVVGLVAFLWIELVYDGAASPRTVATFVTVYAVVNVVAGAVFGKAWFERGDGFEVYSWILSRASPFGRRADGRLVLRNPLDSLAGTPLTPDITPVVMVVLGSTAFDGLSRTPVWSDLIAGSGRGVYLALGTAGLVGSWLAVLGMYNLGIWVSRRFFDDRRDARAEFAHAIIPIAIGYTIAHYFSFAIFQGQQGVLLGTDPLVRGWDLLGVADLTVDYTLISTVAIAIVQVAAIVVGHVVAITASHDRAVTILPSRHVRQGQYPMLTVMVCFTIAGIALISGA